jgi:hypothetical protein
MLYQAVEDYVDPKNDHKDDEKFSLTEKDTSAASSENLRRRSTRPKTKEEDDLKPEVELSHKLNEVKDAVEDDSVAAAEADKSLDNFSLRFARHNPALYLKIAGHLMVMSELVALLTPVVGMGIQWVTAFCDGPPVKALIGLFSLGYECVIHGNCNTMENWKHCILKEY